MAADDRIEIVVANKIAPSVKVDIAAIGSAARDADSWVQKLQNDLAKIGARGSVGSLQKDMANLNVALGRVAVGQDRVATSATKTAIAEAKLAQATAQASKASINASAAAARLAGAESNAARSAYQAEAAALRLAAAQRKATDATNASSTALNKQGNAGGAGLGSLAMKGGAALLGAYTVKEATEAVIGFTDAYTGLQNKLKNVTGSLETTGPLIGRIRDIANSTQQPIDAVAESFARFSRSLSQLGKTQEEALGFTEGVTRLLFQFGKSGGEAASATLQLTQAMGKGKLDGDEFRSVMENLPELMKFVAQELGVTKAELFQMSRTGKITGEVLFNAMERARKEMGNTELPITRLDGAFTKLKNNATVFFGEMETSSRFVRGLTTAIDGLGEALDKFNKRDKTPPTAAMPGGPEFDVMSTIEIPDGAMLDPDFSVALAKARKAEEEARKAHEAKLKAEREFQEVAKKNLVLYEAKKKAEKDTLDFVLEEGNATMRAIELGRMGEKDRFIEQSLDKYKLDAQEKGLKLTQAQIETQRILYREQFKAEQKKTGEKGPDRAFEIAKIVQQLDHQIVRMYELADARAANAQFDSIEESLFGKKIKLNADEEAMIREKIKAVQDYVLIQNEFDRVVGESLKAEKDFVATFEAVHSAYAQGAIDVVRYNREIEKAGRAYDAALDPMYDFNKEFAKQGDLLKLGLRDREIEVQVLELKNTLLEKGLTLTEATAAAEAKRSAFVARRATQEARDAEEKFLSNENDSKREFSTEIDAFKNTRGDLRTTRNTQIVGMVEGSAGQDSTGTEPWLNAQVEAREEAYRRIDELRQQDVISEQAATTLKIRAWQTEQNAKLGIAQEFFSNFEGMQRSQWAEMAVIGKTAAVASATIATYEAANKAYAAMAGIPIVGPSLGIAAAAAAIGSGIANVSAIAAQPTGFAAGGYTGNMPANDVAGVVHGREYVFDAASTARIGRGNLEALRGGDSSAVAANSPDGEGGGSTTVNLTLALVSNKADAEEFLASREGEKMVVEIVGQNARTLSKTFRSA